MGWVLESAGTFRIELVMLRIEGVELVMLRSVGLGVELSTVRGGEEGVIRAGDGVEVDSRFR